MIPRYEWHYVCPAEWLDDTSEEVKEFTPKGTTLQLELVCAKENWLVLSIPCAIDSPVEGIGSYATALLNERLTESLRSPGGILDAVVDETLFRQQVIGATSRTRATTLLDLPPPTYESAAVRAILSQSRGWLMWSWQLKALLMTAGCTAQLAEQITLAHKMLYPRTNRFLDSLCIGRETVLDVVTKAHSWGGLAGNMCLPPHLTGIFSAAAKDIA